MAEFPVVSLETEGSPLLDDVQVALLAAATHRAHCHHSSARDRFSVEETADRMLAWLQHQREAASSAE